MFVAERDYISKLIPPKKFAEKKSAMLEEGWKLTDSGKLDSFKMKNRKQNRVN